MEHEVRNQELALIQDQLGSAVAGENFNFSAANLPQFLQRIERQSERLLSNLEHQENPQNNEQNNQNPASEALDSQNNNSENAENAENHDESEKQGSTDALLQSGKNNENENEEEGENNIEMEKEAPKQPEEILENVELDKKEEEDLENQASSSKLTSKKAKKTKKTGNFFSRLFGSKPHQILDEEDEEEKDFIEKQEENANYSLWLSKLKRNFNKNFPKNIQIADLFDNIWKFIKFLNFELSIFQFIGLIIMCLQMLSLVMVPHLKWFGTFDVLRQFKVTGNAVTKNGAPAIRNSGFASGGLLDAGGELVNLFFEFLYGLRTFKLQFLTFGMFGDAYEMERLKENGSIF